MRIFFSATSRVVCRGFVGRVGCAAGVDVADVVSVAAGKEVNRAEGVGRFELALDRFEESYGWCRLPVCSTDALVLRQTKHEVTYLFRSNFLDGRHVMHATSISG